MEPTVAAALLAGAMGLVGTGVGGVITYLTLTKQLRHQAEESERARALGFRREVYLELAEAIGTGQIFLGSFSRADVDPLRLVEQLHSVPGAVARAQLVATEETFASMDDFGDFFSARVSKLFMLRLRMEHVRRKIAAQERELATLEGLYSHTRFAAEQASSDPTILRQRLADLSAIQSRLDAARDRLAKLTSTNVDITKELGREAYQATLDAQEEAGRLAIRLRRELDLPLDEEWYLERLRHRRKALTPRIDELFSGIDEVIDET